MKNLIRLFVAALLLLQGVGDASANVVAGAAAAASSVRPIVAPVPAAALQLPISNTAISPLTGIGLSPSLTGPSLPTTMAPTLRPSLRTSGMVLPAPKIQPTISAKTRSAVLPAAPRQAPAATSLRTRLANVVRAFTGIKGSGNAKSAKSASISSRLFDGMRKLPGTNLVANPRDVRPPSWNEDRRINKAIEAIYRSEIGKDVYGYVYENHPDITIMIDDDSRADYDSRLGWNRGKPVLYLTEKLVDNDSYEAIGAYIVRELSDLYLASFPESAERLYMAYSNMARSFAEMTDSGLSRYGHWWDQDKDQWSGDAYSMERYYGSWKEAVTDDYYGNKTVRRSAFYRWLKGLDDPGKSNDYGRSLYDLYRRGTISYREYKDMDEYYRGYVGTEASWLRDTERW
ncbi:hypothetical protein ACFL2T_04845 [Elusimicrobiota bacterium]